MHKKSIEYQVCSRCVMDSSANDITFDEHSNCNYCSEFLDKFSKLKSNPSKKKLENFINQIKNSSKNKKYDCILGLSGGLDSCWALVKAVELGLKPLAVHMDNGWNTELAQNNIENLVKILNVDLYTEVLDWNIYQNW